MLLMAFVAFTFTALTMLGRHSAATDARGVPPETRTVVVEQGDTLWDIAAALAAPGEVRQMVHRIEELNALPSSSLEVGQELAVPAG